MRRSKNQTWRSGNPLGHGTAAGPASLLQTLLFAGIALTLSSCTGDEARKEDYVSFYQQTLVKKGPQQRAGETGLGLLQPAPQPALPELKVSEDPNTGGKVVSLSIDEALARALANSPELRAAGFEPSIAKEEITQALAAFDFTSFGRWNYETVDRPADSVVMGGQQNSRLWEAGLKQKNILGSEASASYALTRNWDDATNRFPTLSTRVEPMLLFEVKQPILRDAWEDFNRSGIDIAKLNHHVSLVGFRQTTEQIATQVVTAYWALLQAQTEVEIQQSLLEKTRETLSKVRDREGIDATTADIKQAETFLKTRESQLLEAQKRRIDVQEALLRLLSDSQIPITDELRINPTSSPTLITSAPEPKDVLLEAVENNPLIQQANLKVEVANINVRVADNQRMPRLDFVASARIRGLDRDYRPAHEQVWRGDYVSYVLGAYLEFPLGNRLREAELRKRKLELSQAESILQNTSDQVAVQAKERLRQVERTQKDMQVQKEAVDAARIYLQGLEDTERVRPSLTPEFLFVKLQAQGLLAEAQRAEIRAIADFNSALVQLAQSMGTVLQLHQVRASLPETTN